MRTILFLALTLSGCAVEDGQTESQGERAAAMLLLGGTAFTNGMTQRPVITCTSIGGITTCQ